MDIRKIIYALGSLLLLNLLFNCDPPREFCDDINHDVTVPDLININPLQSTYHQGDELRLSISINATNMYYGGIEQNIYEITGNNKARITFISDDLFTNNSLIFIKGEQGQQTNHFILRYNSVTEEYKLEIKIKLNRIGQYTVYTGGERIIFLNKNEDDCNNFIVETNIAGMNESGNIEFEVLP